ncbi:MAG: tripartite tricarboxylate transporter substrate binding protein, partial [Proteobacteria bacterium]|nr:tripartite tricarboxylate transporter substrate binding protein [Pseudomonadota bacterium]
SMAEINPSTYANLRWSIDDFLPLIKGVEAPLVLVVHPSVKANSLAELVAWVKSSPGKLSYASFSPGSQSAFLGYQLNERFGLDLAHVPYKGSGPQTQDLIAGHALLGFGQLQSTLPHVRAGKLKALAVTSATRSPHLPDVPTFAELGNPDFTAAIWFGLMIKAGTPATIADPILAAAKAAHADPQVRKNLENQGLSVSGQSGAEFAASVRTQIVRWGKLVKASGYKAN